jgi:hypothetical protein
MTTISAREPGKPFERMSWAFNDHDLRDVVAFCPACKTMETVSLKGEVLASTSRFTQKGDAVYHACGLDVACRLFNLH